jgi:hypothetical protein
LLQLEMWHREVLEAPTPASTRSTVESTPGS